MQYVLVSLMQNSKKPLLIVFLTVFIDLVGFGIVIPLSPYLAKEYGADALQVGLLLTIYSLMQFLFSPFWGQLSVRVGRRPIILMSVFGAGLAHLLFGFAQSYLVLFIARLFAGLFGANISTAFAYVADVTDEANRSKGMGIVGAAFGLGFVFGPFLGAELGHLGEQLGEAAPFGSSFAAIGAAVICFVNTILAYFYLPESLPGKSAYAAQDKLTRSAKGLKQRLQGLVSALRRPALGRLMVVYFLATTAMAHMEAALFLYVKDDFGLSLRQAGYGFAYVGILIAFTQGFLIRRLIPKFGDKKVLLAGLLMTAIGLAGIGFVDSVLQLGLVVTFLGLGSGLYGPSLNGLVSLLAGKSEQGAVMGTSQSFSALGRILGPVMGGVIYRDLGHEFPFWVAGGLCLLGLLLAFSVLASDALSKPALKHS